MTFRFVCSTYSLREYRCVVMLCRYQGSRYTSRGDEGPILTICTEALVHLSIPVYTTCYFHFSKLFRLAVSIVWFHQRLRPIYSCVLTQLVVYDRIDRRSSKLRNAQHVYESSTQMCYELLQSKLETDSINLFLIFSQPSRLNLQLKFKPC